MRGARWVQSELLDENPDMDVAVYAVFFEVVTGDEGARYEVDPREILNDPRVSVFWDERRLVGRWFEENVTRLGKQRGDENRVEWDAYFLFGREAEWTDRGPRVWTWGRTIYSQRDRLRKELEQLLSAD